MDQDKINTIRKKQQEEALRKEQLDTLNSVAARVSSSVYKSTAETMQTLKDTTKDIAKTSDIDKVLEQLKETQLASYLSGSQKSPIIMADSTELGAAVKSLGEKLDQLLKATSNEKSDTELIKTVKSELNKVVTALNRDNETNMIKAIEGLRPLLENIDVRPVVNVPQAKINVAPTPVDFTPLTDALNKSDAKDGVYLEDYKAQDIASDDVHQYIGFIAPSGEWYIVENDIEGGSLRYYFGKNNYSGHWKIHNGLDYKLLNEAINAIQA